MRISAVAAAVLAITAASRTARADERSPDTAVEISLGVTLGGIGVEALGAHMNDTTVSAVGFGAFVLGPTAGHWYAGEVVTPGLGLRVVGGGLALYGLSQTFGCVYDSGGCHSDGSGPAFALIGSAAFLGGAVYDIATAGSAADHYNAEHAHLSIAPTALRGAHGDTAPGMMLVGSF